MADFRQAFANTLKWEDSVPSGKVTPEPGGGRARFGINSIAHPNMPADFWDGDPAAEILRAEDVYKYDYWIPICGMLIKSQAVANKLFDMAVNMGVGEAVKLCQESLNLLQDRETTGDVEVDGKMGPKTLDAINAVYDGALLEQLREISEKFYRDLCEREPNHKPFLEDYLARAAV